MPKFVTGKELEEIIYDIIWDASQTLLIVSPFIKLDDYFKKIFDKHKNNPKIHLIVVFGKNEGTVSRSFSKSDFEYFKDFLNISIIYVPNLHAKYYGNERKGVITSINLYDYSFKNNIEFGVYSENSIVEKLTTSTDKQAWYECMDIAMNNEAVFIKRPMYEKKILSSILGKNYVKSEVLHDVTSKLYASFSRDSSNKLKMKLSDFGDELILGSNWGERPTRDDEVREKQEGYCIRTGAPIPYNPKRPFSEEAFKSWVKYANKDYPENYCHKTGKKSYGKTSMSHPILTEWDSRSNL